MLDLGGKGAGNRGRFTYGWINVIYKVYMRGAVGYETAGEHVQAESSTTCSGLNMMSKFGSEESANTGSWY